MGRIGIERAGRIQLDTIQTLERLDHPPTRRPEPVAERTHREPRARRRLGHALPGRLVIPSAKPRPTQSAHQLPCIDELRTELERSPLIDVIDVVVIPLEAQAPLSQPLSEAVELVVGHVADQMGPSCAPPLPTRLVHEHSHPGTVAARRTSWSWHERLHR